MYKLKICINYLYITYRCNGNFYYKMFIEVKEWNCKFQKLSFKLSQNIGIALEWIRKIQEGVRFVNVALPKRKT